MLWLMKLANASCCGNGKRDCDNLKIFLSPTSPCHCVTTTWHGTTSTLAFTNTTMNAHHGLHTPTSAPHQDNKWGDSMNGGTRRRCVSCPRLQGIFFFPFFLLCITITIFFLRFIERFVSLCYFFICRTDTRVKYSFVLCFTFCFTYRFIIVSLLFRTSFRLFICTNI